MTSCRRRTRGDFTVSYRFATTLTGYPGWVWTITVAQLPGEEPTIVESELLPADGALLAPDWVPWSERMDEYRAAQAALGEAVGGEAASDDDDELDELDDDELDDDDDDLDGRGDDDFGSGTLHGGDLDGVDIDELDDSSDGTDELIEFDLEPLDLQVDQSDEPEPEGDGGSEDPPRVPGRRKRAGKEQQGDQGD
ncbi:MAG: DUF3027 domain-containing protein [Galbitalea sp.]